MTRNNPNNETYDGIEVPVLEKLSKINSKARTILLEVLGEFERNVNLSFTRVYPAAGTDYYDKLFETQRPNNKLLYKYLFE